VSPSTRIVNSTLIADRLLGGDHGGGSPPCQPFACGAAAALAMILADGDDTMVSYAPRARSRRATG
jgi:hypothetical protein